MCQVFFLIWIFCSADSPGREWNFSFRQKINKQWYFFCPLSSCLHASFVGYFNFFVVVLILHFFLLLSNVPAGSEFMVFIYCHFCIQCTDRRILDHKIRFSRCISLFFFCKVAVFLLCVGIITQARIRMESCIICLNICFWYVHRFSGLWFTWFIYTGLFLPFNRINRNHKFQAIDTQIIANSFFSLTFNWMRSVPFDLFGISIDIVGDME